MFSVAVSQFIQEVYNPHKKIGMTNFLHDITFEQGQISMMLSDHHIAEHYKNLKIPTWGTDESGRALADGIYLNKTLENTRKDCAILMPRLKKIGEKFNQNYGKSSLHIIAHENDCQHLYALFFDLDENDFLQWVINNGEYLKDFIANYKNKSKDIILEAKTAENRIVLPTTTDFLESKNLKSVNEGIFQKTAFTIIHKDLQIPVHLPKQQGRCLLLMSQGKTAKEIAQELQISFRTVEYYFEKTRKQLGSETNKKLIAEYGEQFIFM